jgi:hypothetical protein
VVKHHEVPTHLNVEDKVLFGLSVRQFLYLLVGSSAAYSLWQQATLAGDVVRAALTLVALFTTAAFALLQPADRPLEEWLVAALVYVASPRRAIWKPREPQAADWRPAGGAWQELTPDLFWVEREDAECE